MDLIPLIQQIGFPIAVAAYLLINGSKERKEMTAAINNLSDLIQRVVLKDDKKP